MSNLRSELVKTKQEREVHINEAAYKWVENNVILINEKIDRKTVTRLTDNILKFDEKFGPFKTKIPTIARQLDAAENNLELVVTGKVNDKKASDMLKQLSYLYRVYSDFFSKDLPILLNTKIFSAAKENPEVRLDSLQPNEGQKHSPNVIRDAFKHAISPSKEEQKLAKKIYSPNNIPTVDAIGVANELLTLNYNDLQKLTNIETMPMVATDEIANESKQINENLLLEVNIDKLRTLNNNIQQLENMFNPFQDRLPNLNKVLDDLKIKLSDVQSNLKAGAMDKVKSFFGGGVEKSILATHDIFRNFKQVASEIIRLMNKAPADKTLEQLLVDPNNGKLAANAVKMLQQSVKPGIFGKSVIEPRTFAYEISKLSMDELKKLSSGISLPDTKDVQPELNEPQIKGQQPQAAQAPAPEQPQAPAPEQPPEQPQAPAPEQPQAPAPEQPQAPAPEQPPEQPQAAQAADLKPADVVTSLLKKYPKLSNKTRSDVSAAVDYLKKNGFKITQQ